MINQKNNMVSFKEETSLFNSVETNKNLEDRITKSIDLSNRLKKMDQEIGSSLSYLARVIF